MRKPTGDEKFVRRYESFERDAVEAFLLNLDRSGQELRNGIEHLIREREKLRDEEIASLEAASAKVMKELAGFNQRKLLEELTCFRDVLALQRRLLERNGKQ